MLNGIKNLINQKEEFQESANLLEEKRTDDLDDLIVLGEESEPDEMEEDGNESNDENHEDDDTGDGNHEDDNDDIMDADSGEEPKLPGDDDPAAPTGMSEPVGGNPDDDLMSANADEEPALPGDDLPTPIGRQTGEPVADDLDDLMKVEVDLKSNTMSDVLPIPPATAGAAIAEEDEDIMSQNVGSGFGEESSGNFEESKKIKISKETENVLGQIINDMIKTGNVATIHIDDWIEADPDAVNKGNKTTNINESGARAKIKVSKKVRQELLKLVKDKTPIKLADLDAAGKSKPTDPPDAVVIYADNDGMRRILAKERDHMRKIMIVESSSDMYQKPTLSETFEGAKHTVEFGKFTLFFTESESDESGADGVPHTYEFCSEYYQKYAGSIAKLVDRYISENASALYEYIKNPVDSHYYVEVHFDEVNPLTAVFTTADNSKINIKFESGIPTGDSPVNGSYQVYDSNGSNITTTFAEAITLDGGAGDQAAAAAPAQTAQAAPAEPVTGADGDPAPVDDNAAGTEQDPGPAPDAENPVTAAVRDKVAEMDNPADTGTPQDAAKETLLKKLGTITKNLEDAKKAIMDTIQ